MPAARVPARVHAAGLGVAFVYLVYLAGARGGRVGGDLADTAAQAPTVGLGHRETHHTGGVLCEGHFPGRDVNRGPVHVHRWLPVGAAPTQAGKPKAGRRGAWCHVVKRQLFVVKVSDLIRWLFGAWQYPS